MALQIELVSAVGRADILAVFVTEGDVLAQLKKVGLDHSDLAQIIADQKFKGAKGSICAWFANQDYKYLVVAGLGKANPTIDIENLRRAVAKVVRSGESFSAKTLMISLPESSLFGVDYSYLVEHVVQVAQIANHKFDTYLTDESKKELNLKVSLVVNVSSELQNALERGVLIAQAVNQTREWVDLPANHLNPKSLADKMVAIAKESGLKHTVYNEAEIIAMGMGGLHAVSRGSAEDCRFVLLEYDCGDPKAPKIALVGKGIIYDTGGLSIKPAQSMETMKEDMAGAAAVASAMQVIAKLKPKVNVVGCAPLAENMPSGTAGRPGDIVTFYNGKTAEVKNTDAEGRLILADALSYVVKHYQLAAVIDIATLTGACEYALGNFFSGLISDQDALAATVTKAGEKSGDYVWRLPFTDDYKAAMKSEIADLSNIASGRYKAGTINGACFLHNFIGDVPWAHLDIANTAYDVPMLPYYRPDSATGAGVRLLIELVMSWQK